MIWQTDITHFALFVKQKYIYLLVLILALEPAGLLSTQMRSNMSLAIIYNALLGIATPG